MTDAELDQLRGDSALLHSIISRQVTLKREGNHWKGRCPFHEDRDPSFAVYDNGFCCFACGVKGSVFDYVMLRDRVEFARAVEIIAAERGPTPKTKTNGLNPDWRPIVPAPRDAPRPTDQQLACDMLHEYCGADDQLLCYVRRIEATGGKRKQFLPLTYGSLNGRSGWHDRAPATPRPLYRLNALAHAAPDATVLVCEGEKAADAAQRLFPDMVAMTWMGGANADGATDFTALQGRSIILWPDADQPGRDVMTRIAKRLPQARFLDTTDLADGYDARDLEQDDCDDPDAWLQARLRKPDAPDPAECLPFRWGASLVRVLDVQDFVEGLLTTSCLAVIYGDSNVGKSFWAIDLGLHIAGGIPWNGRAVDQGIVILIALEGGRSIDNRIITAREHLDLPPTVPFVVVQCPIDLRTNTADAERLVNTVNQVISECTGPMPVRLVIIDTMSRALNGGAENAEDMSALLANADRIRADAGVAILFVAHCGKDATKGIRGWSGIRAAIDVEIEATRLDGGTFVAEVTKERDLPVGDRFGFKLDVIELGHNQRGKPVTTCVVAPTDTPAKKKKRTSRPLTDRQAVLWTHVQGLMAESGEPIAPVAGMPMVTGMERRMLRQGLIQRGWFAEGQLFEDGKLRKAATTDENNGLTALKRRGLAEFNRQHVWLP
jgi:hypothetical protein